MFNYLKTLAPCVPGPWQPYRNYVNEQMMEMGVKPGDIVCRLGNAYFYGFFWLSKFIANVTKSRYSHVGIITDVTDDDIIIADVSTSGMRRQFAPEWSDDVWGQDILIIRYNGDPFIPTAAVENVKSLHLKLPSYDETFAEKDKFYCTELICWSYIRAGVNLCHEVPIRDLPGWKWQYNWWVRLNGVDPATKVWCVGNEDIGLLSSKDIVKIGRIILPSVRRHKIKHAPAYAGG